MIGPTYQWMLMTPLISLTKSPKAMIHWTHVETSTVQTIFCLWILWIFFLHFTDLIGSRPVWTKFFMEALCPKHEDKQGKKRKETMFFLPEQLFLFTCNWQITMGRRRLSQFMTFFIQISDNCQRIITPPLPRVNIHNSGCNTSPDQESENCATVVFLFFFLSYKNL